jgi:hypothetical protein
VRPVEGLEQLTLEVRLTENAIVVAPRPGLEPRAIGETFAAIVIGVVLALAAALVFALTR